jgi:hypothetical protein
MPSRDPINPTTNSWLAQDGLVSSDSGRPSATAPQALTRDGSRIEQREMSAQVQRLARRLGKDPDEVARKIPMDTLRRTKYPVLEQVDEDGMRSFKHDPMIEEARVASRRV